MTHKRKNVSARQIRRLTGGQNAHAAIGTLEPGCEIFGFSKGQFSKINLLTALLEQTGPANVTVCTWSALHGHIDDVHVLLKNQAILSMRWLIDFSFLSRRPDYIANLRHRFADDCIRVTSCHAKFMIIRNERWNLAIRTSMNLTDNPRFENFEISDDPGLADFLDRMVDEVFETPNAPATFDSIPQEHKDAFSKFGTDPNAGDSADHLGISLDDPAKPGLSQG